MKRMAKVLGVGVLALLAGALMPHSSARAQDAPEGCVTDSLDSNVTFAQDGAAKTIFCSERVECAALECKEKTAELLADCLKEAGGNAAAVKHCDAAAITLLDGCQLAGARGDAACYIDPTGGTTVP